MVIGAVLARILGPKPFGQAIIAITIHGFVNLFVDGGFSQALIQKKEVSDLEIRRTFTSQILIGLLSSTIVFAAAPLIARLFHDPGAAPVVRVMSILLTIQSIGLVSAALLRRQMRFRAIQYARLTGYLAGYLLLGIPLAFLGAGVWSLVAAYLAQGAVSSVLLYWAARHPIRLSFALPHRSIRVFGGTIVANNIANWGLDNLDNIAASQLGPVALGLYGRSFNFAHQPCSAIVNGVQSVLLSATSKVQERKELLGEITLSALGAILGILGPAYATLFLLPYTVMIGLYGPKWVLAVPLMAPLAISTLLYGSMSLLGPILCGAGRPSLEFWPMAISCAVAAVAYFAAAKWSLVAVAWAVCSVTILRFLLMAVVTFRLLHVQWSKAISLIFRRLLFSCGFALIPWAFDHFLVFLNVNVSVRLFLVFGLSLCLMGACIWYASAVVFGYEALTFLLRYGAHLPAIMERRIRLAVHGENLQNAAP